MSLQVRDKELVLAGVCLDCNKLKQISITTLIKLCTSEMNKICAFGALLHILFIPHLLNLPIFLKTVDTTNAIQQHKYKRVCKDKEVLKRKQLLQTVID